VGFGLGTDEAAGSRYIHFLMEKSSVMHPMEMARHGAVMVLLTVLALLLVEWLMVRITRGARVSPLAFRPLLFVFRGTVIVLSLAVFVKDAFGLDLLPVLGGTLAVLGAAFVAFWSVLSNISCTFLLLLFRPFSVGDFIEVQGEGARGEVVDLNLLYTTLESEGGLLMQVPNSLFFQKVISRRIGQHKRSLEDQLTEEHQPEKS